MCGGSGDGNSGGWSMVIAAQVCIGAHLMVRVSNHFKGAFLEFDTLAGSCSPVP